MDWILSTLTPAGVLAVVIVGCRSVDIDQIESEKALEVRLDANARSCAVNMPRPLKFFLDITNHTKRTINLTRLTVELRAVLEHAPETIVLREEWTYRWPQEVLLGPEKKLSIPIVPERNSPGVAGEFPLEALAKGEYGIVAVVNNRHVSEPYRLKVLRPDLERAPLRRT
jgi:hypothetical protein